jgi:hypothetical protein
MQTISGKLPAIVIRDFLFRCSARSPITFSGPIYLDLMLGPDAGHAGELSFRDFFRLPRTKENRSQSVDPACRLFWGLLEGEVPTRPSSLFAPTFQYYGQRVESEVETLIVPDDGVSHFARGRAMTSTSSAEVKDFAGDAIPPKCAVIEVHVGELKQLFDAIDPSPFREREPGPESRGIHCELGQGPAS